MQATSCEELSMSNGDVPSNMAGLIDEKAAKDREPIRFSDEFRHAKRNTLFWTAVTFLLAVGEPSGSEAIEINAIVRNFSFPQGLLLLTSLVILVFMTIGFRRADMRVFANHTGFAVANRLKDAAELADTVWSKLDHTLRSGEQLEQEIEKRMTRLDDLTESALSKLADAADLRSLETSHPFARVVVDPEQANPSELKTAHRQLREKLDFVRRVVETERGNFTRNMDPSQTPRPLPDLPAECAKLQEQAADLAKLGTSLRTFSDAIGKGERIWYFLYDQTLVYGAACFSAVMACLKLRLIFLS
jgi:phosphate uptake regulator